MSLDNNGKVVDYQEFNRTVYDQLDIAHKAAKYATYNYGSLPDGYGTGVNKYTQPNEFLTKIQNGYCFAGSQAQAYSDLFKNTETLLITNKKPFVNGEYIEALDPEKHHPNAVTAPLKRTYSVSLDSNSALKIVLTNEKVCSDFVYIRTDDAGDHPTAAKWDVYKRNKWVESTPNTVVTINTCENWQAPLKEYLIKIYNLPKELF
jgi:hypothetical protein